ncbi:hypothetical protein MLD38_035525 [Melastoma candidum]|uniref:Uncharacterized protein n=1 Tax=Melastoma candidum TaxID=119954 RepID=A0ACB9LGG5_9MYRT|nr:hypothetical protein MLD38_035525 [Melastoma candidum]
MATSETEAPPELSTAMDGAFPAVEIEKELNPGLNTEVTVDPISSEVVAKGVEIKEQAEAPERKREKDKCEALQTLKSAILISAAIVAVAGAAFAINKKLREK